MGPFRKTLPFLSLLLLAVLVAAQAAGCCKWSALLSWAIAAPMVGGVFTSVLMELVAYPALFYLWKRRGLHPDAREAA
jgi:multidrug efflux pump subunit AcrB